MQRRRSIRPASRVPVALAATLLLVACAGVAPRADEDVAGAADTATAEETAAAQDPAAEAPAGPTALERLREAPFPRTQARSLAGRVRVACEPADAEVVIDGVTRGLASDFAAPGYIELTEGAHRIELRKQGYATYRAEVVVSAEVMETIPVTLRRLPGAIPAKGAEPTQEDG